MKAAAIEISSIFGRHHRARTGKLYAKVVELHRRYGLDVAVDVATCNHKRSNLQSKHYERQD